MIGARDKRHEESNCQKAKEQGVQNNLGINFMFMLAYLAFYQCDVEFDLNLNNFF